MVEQHGMPIAMSVDEVAKGTDLSPRKVWGLVKSGELPSRRIGRRVIVLRSDLLTYLEGRPSAATCGSL